MVLTQRVKELAGGRRWEAVGSPGFMLVQPNDGPVSLQTHGTCCVAQWNG